MMVIINLMIIMRITTGSYAAGEEGLLWMGNEMPALFVGSTRSTWSFLRLWWCLWWLLIIIMRMILSCVWWVPDKYDDHDESDDHDDSNAHDRNGFDEWINFTYPCQRGHVASTSLAEMRTIGKNPSVFYTRPKVWRQNNHRNHHPCPHSHSPNSSSLWSRS